MLGVRRGSGRPGRGLGGAQSPSSSPRHGVAQPARTGIGRRQVKTPRPRGQAANGQRGAWRSRLGPGARSVRTRSLRRARSSPLAPRVAVAAAAAARPPRVPAALRSLRPARGALGRSGQSVPAAALRPWPPRSTRRLAGRRTTWCATTARQSSGEELSIALQAPLPELARGLVH